MQSERFGEENVKGNDPQKTSGTVFAPRMIERFTKVEGDTLKLYYTLSTWNPYTVVLMRSDFTIGDAGDKRGGD